MPMAKRRASTDDEDAKSNSSKKSRRSESANDADSRKDGSDTEEDEENVFKGDGEPVEISNEEERKECDCDEDMPSNSSGLSRGFEYLEHPADILLHAWGTNDAEAMGALIESLYGVLTERDGIEEMYSYEMDAEGDTEDVLIFNTLQEALYGFQAEPYFVGHRVEVTEIERKEDGSMTGIHMRAWGESFERGKHVQNNDVKAPTYSNMQIKREGDRVDLYVVVDV